MWLSPVKTSSVVLGHAISIRDQDELKQFGISRQRSQKYFSWSCRTQDLFNGESRLIFTAKNPAVVFKWINKINSLVGAHAVTPINKLTYTNSPIQDFKVKQSNRLLNDYDSPETADVSSEEERSL
jgi:hypothetical protein